MSTDPTGGSTLPPPDPAAGEQAAAAAEDARDQVELQLSQGQLDLAGVFSQLDAETGTGHHQIGHMHARALLLALPKIGEKRANEILDGLGIAHDEHIDVLGANQRQALIDAVAAA